VVLPLPESNSTSVSPSSHHTRLTTSTARSSSQPLTPARRFAQLSDACVGLAFSSLRGRATRGELQRMVQLDYQPELIESTSHPQNQGPDPLPRPTSFDRAALPPSTLPSISALVQDSGYRMAISPTAAAVAVGVQGSTSPPVRAPLDSSALPSTPPRRRASISSSSSKRLSATVVQGQAASEFRNQFGNASEKGSHTSAAVDSQQQGPPRSSSPSLCLALLV
jgi:hypothetical protein